mgnify:CR=1 FL=1
MWIGEQFIYFVNMFIVYKEYLFKYTFECVFNFQNLTCLTWLIHTSFLPSKWNLYPKMVKKWFLFPLKKYIPPGQSVFMQKTGLNWILEHILPFNQLFKLKNHLILAFDRLLTQFRRIFVNVLLQNVIFFV